MVIEVKGDIRDTDCKLIAHGVNCQNVMGSGVARALFKKWPKVKDEYHNHFEGSLKFYHPEEMLGGVFFDVVNDEGLIVAQCFTQQNYGKDGQMYLSYDALTECLRSIAEFCQSHRISEFAMPKIGCGLAGGDWEIVRNILDRFFSDEDITVKVYSL